MIRRTARQCRERWKLYLSPDIKNGPWSREEDSQLTNLVSSEGRLWAQIAQSFDNRTDVNVKNRWVLLHRGNKRGEIKKNIYEEKSEYIKDDSLLNIIVNVKEDINLDSQKGQNEKEIISKSTIFFDLTITWEDIKW